MRLHHAVMALFVVAAAGGWGAAQQTEIKARIPVDAGAAAFSPDGHYLALGGGLLRMWDLTTNEEVLVKALIAGGVAFSPDGKWLAVAPGAPAPEGVKAKAAPIILLSAPKWKKAGEIGDTACAKIVFSPDSKTLAAECYGAQVQVWSVPAGREKPALLKKWQFQEEHFNPGGIAYSPDGKLLAAKDVSGAFTIWSMPDGAMLQHIDRHGGDVTALVFSPDGKRIASGSFDQTVKIWRVADGALYRTIAAGDQVCSLAFSPDGHYVISGGAEQNGKIWRLADGERVFNMGHHPGYVTAVAFSPDGTRVVTVGKDAVVWSWIPPKELPAEMAEPADTSSQRARQRREAEGFKVKAVASLNAGDTKSAMTFVEAAIKADPEYGDGYIFRARLNFMNGAKDDAFADLPRALKYNPRDASSWFYEGLMWYEAGDYPDALTDLIQCTHFEGCDPRAHLYAGMIQLAFEHDGGKAADEIGIYLAKNPDDKEAQGLHEQAEDLARRQGRISPEDAARQKRSRGVSLRNVLLIIANSLIDAGGAIDAGTSRQNAALDADDAQRARSSAESQKVFLQGRRDLEKVWGLPKGTMGANSAYSASGIH